MSATSPTFADVVEVAITHGHVDLAGLLGAAIWHADRRRVELEDLVDRLVTDLATAWGVPESVVRARQGLVEPGSANEAHRAVSGGLSAHHRQATTRTRKVDQ